MDKKTTAPMAAVLAMGIAIGAGGHRMMAPAHAVTPRVLELRILGDGQLAADLYVKDGGGGYGRQLVWDKEGGTPRLNGKPIADQAAADLGKAAVVFARRAAELVEQLAVPLSR